MPSALPVDWRARLHSRLLPAPDHGLEHSPTLAAAAVLVPIVLHPDAPALLLTVRASHLRSHAGQISFPGGRVEPTDLDPAAAAVRETLEEIGIDAPLIQTVGFLSDQIVRTGYRITPVVALLQPGFTLKPDSTEVAEVFELPLAFALSPGNYRSHSGRARALELESWELPFGERNIWGATAGILAKLRDLLLEGAA